MSNNIYPPPYALTEAGGVPCIVDRDGTVIAVMASNSDARAIGSILAMVKAINALVASDLMRGAGWELVWLHGKTKKTEKFKINGIVLTA